MNLPNAQTVCDALDVTWPAAAKSAVPGFTIREGKGGGQRVSAATTNGAFDPAQIAGAESAMRALGQTPLFMIRSGDDDLAAHLDAAGYVQKDTTLLYAIPTADITGVKPPPVTSFQVWPPLATQREIWAEGGTGPARLAVMDRADCPKTTFLGRANDRPAGTAYAGVAHECTMLHSLEVLQSDRRQGLAAHLTRASAIWGQAQGAKWFTLAAVAANAGANALYTSLGMQVVGQYHYRIKPD
ncbi:MAG: GNAT family N-acetyltransferase [Yoonia sp.]|uniref:GNAT family N-acetyltransferase n=2 Tax=Yoonia sp. TaxID=2212373 RepID=UPI003262D2DB